MAGTFRKGTLTEIYGHECPGERPWLGPKAIQKGCTETPQTIQRGAANAYFAQVVSSILIPPYSTHVRQILDRSDVWSEIEALQPVDGKLYEPFLRAKAKNLGVDPDAFVAAVNERLGAEQESASEAQDVSENAYRYDEYRAFVDPRPRTSVGDDFDTRQLPASEYRGAFADLFERVVLVRKLRETRVLTGFSRLIPVEALKGPPAALSLEPKNWLPGFSVRGEGIFLELNGPALRRWSAQEEIKRRAAILQNRSNDVRGQRGITARTVTPEFILVHTLAHLIIRQMAFECGYDSSSIRERLYVSAVPATSVTGLLLYTASGDAEGTLGGLVRQGRPGRLEPTLRSAMRNASICSSDPLCLESAGQGLFGMNLAACHACGLLPETSCEEGNLLLDRVTAIGTPDRPALGYFGSMIDE